MCLYRALYKKEDQTFLNASWPHFYFRLAVINSFLLNHKVYCFVSSTSDPPGLLLLFHCITNYLWCIINYMLSVLAPLPWLCCGSSFEQESGTSVKSGFFSSVASCQLCSTGIFYSNYYENPVMGMSTLLEMLTHFWTVTEKKVGNVQKRHQTQYYLIFAFWESKYCLWYWIKIVRRRTDFILLGRLLFF